MGDGEAGEGDGVGALEGAAGVEEEAVGARRRGKEKLVDVGQGEGRLGRVVAPVQAVAAELQPGRDAAREEQRAHGTDQQRDRSA